MVAKIDGCKQGWGTRKRLTSVAFAIPSVRARVRPSRRHRPRPSPIQCIFAAVGIPRHWPTSVRPRATVRVRVGVHLDLTNSLTAIVEVGTRHAELLLRTFVAVAVVRVQAR